MLFIKDLEEFSWQLLLTETEYVVKQVARDAFKE